VEMARKYYNQVSEETPSEQNKTVQELFNTKQLYQLTYEQHYYLTSLKITF
jgi:hypothetical protein